MTTQEKSNKIKQLALEMLNESHQEMIKKIDKALACGAIDIENWDERRHKMILPKCIIAAILESEAVQYKGRGTSFEREVKREITNIKYFI